MIGKTNAITIKLDQGARRIIWTFSALTAVLLCAIAFIAWRESGFQDRWGYFVVLPLLLGLNLIFLAIARRHCLNYCPVLLSFLLAVYLAEAYFLLVGVSSRSIYFQARRAGATLDPRHIFSVVLDLRRNGVEAFPAAAHPWVWSTPVSGVPNPNRIRYKDLLSVYPLTGISGVTLVLCNESGRYATYQSDEHGFNNPRGLYAEPPIDAVVLGDSFTQGWCVAPEHSIGGQLCRMLPGVRLLAFGDDGNGPLITLATLTEYARPLRPSIVYWLYFEGNDLLDLSARLDDPLLARYLADAKFSQNLISRQHEVDDIIKSIVEPVYQAWFERAPGSGRLDQEGLIVRIKDSPIAGFFVLRDLREAIRVMLERRRQAAATKLSASRIDRARTFEIFEQTLASAKQRAARWGGQLVFVYLPEHRSLETPARSAALFSRESVLEVVERLEIPVLDATPVLLRLPDPLAVFPFRVANHYNERGYSEVAKLIRGHIQRARQRRPGDVSAGHSSPVGQPRDGRP